MQFYLKHSNDESYICIKQGRDSDTPTFCTNKNEALDLQISHMNNGIVSIKPTKDAKKTFDIANNDKLIVYPFHGGPNQQFILNMVAPNTFAMINRGKCLEYNNDSTFYHVRACTYTGHQLYSIVLTDYEQASLNLPSPLEDTYYGGDVSESNRYGQNLLNEESTEVQIPSRKRSRRTVHRRKHCHYNCH